MTFEEICWMESAARRAFKSARSFAGPEDTAHLDNVEYLLAEVRHFAQCAQSQAAEDHPKIIQRLVDVCTPTGIRRKETT